VAGRHVVGLDIGTSGVRAAELTFGKSVTTRERFGQVALPPGAVRDGEVVDTDAVAGALKQLWSQTKFSSRKVIVGVANQKVVVRQVDLPWQPIADLRKSLAFQVQDHIPMPVEQALLDFHPLEEFTDDSGAWVMRLLLVAASRDMVSASLAAVTKAGLRPVMVDLTSFAVLRSLAGTGGFGLGDTETQAQALVDVGSRVTNIVVHQGGVPRFVRILLLGGGDITEAVAERLGVPAEEAEAVKQSVGLSAVPGGAPDGQPANRAIEIAGAGFVDEVRGSLDYYLGLPGSVRIDRLVLSGGGGQLAGLAERLAAATRLPVEHGSAMAALSIGKTGLSPEQLNYVEPLATVPVGLALGMAS
jgi:type IV pilus assembly protein PilM